MNNIEQVIKERIKQFEIVWETHPFPHAIIDNFLPSDVYAKITESLNQVDNFKDIKKKFISHVEFNKNVYGDKDLKGILRLPINILGGVIIKDILESYLNVQKLISLCDWPDYAGYYPFHSMKVDGILGSHVDHSHSKNGDLHVANSVFFVSPKWESSWGGETLLFSNTGLKIIKKIIPATNRLVLFIHSSSSFHGVNKISSPVGVNRNSYYMDYYVHDKQLPQMHKTLKTKGSKNLVYSFHSTSFVPFFPLGIKSFKIKSLFMKNTYPYLKVFFRYLAARFLLNYSFARMLKRSRLKKYL